MAHYIDADRLRAEIERRRLSNRYIDTEGYESELLDIITSLQQEQTEMNLDQDTVLDYVHEHYYYDKDFDGYGHGKFRPVFTRNDLIDLANYFYKLGRNTRKEK